MEISSKKYTIAVVKLTFYMVIYYANFKIIKKALKIKLVTFD